MTILVYPPTIDWSWMKQRPQQLMQALAAIGYTVYYCNPTIRDRAPEIVGHNLTIIHNTPEWLSRSWPELRERADEPVVVWCTWPKLYRELDVYRADVVIYDCVDEFTAWLADEPEMVRRADALVCTADRLRLRLARLYPDKPLTLVRNGYDTNMGLHLPVNKPASKDRAVPSQAHIESIDTTRSERRPPVIADSRLRRVGYVGAWASWVDAALVRRIPDVAPDLEVVIVGPEFGRKQSAVRDERIRYAGLRPHSELAAWIRSMDVCIIPFRLTPVTLATNPVKAYEYLAAGKPVVSTALPECELLRPHIDIGRTPEQFLRQIEARLANPGDGAARTEEALRHTWTARAAQADAVIRKACGLEPSPEPQHS